VEVGQSQSQIQKARLIHHMKLEEDDGEENEWRKFGMSRCWKEDAP